VLILLGTNDLKARFSVPAYDIAEGARVLVGLVLASQAGIGGLSPQVLLLARWAQKDLLQLLLSVNL
jgi:hypothetical protein